MVARLPVEAQEPFGNPAGSYAVWASRIRSKAECNHTKKAAHHNHTFPVKQSGGISHGDATLLLETSSEELPRREEC